MNTVSIEIEDNNIPLSFDENSLNNLFYDDTEFNKNFYTYFPIVFKYNNSDSMLEKENEEKNSQMNIEVEKTKDKSSDIKSNHIVKEKNEKKLLGRKTLKHNSKNYSKNSKSHKNEANDEKKSIQKKGIFFKNNKIYRLDYYIKAIKENILKFIMNTLNKLYKECHFDNEFENMKFHMPNYKKYQGNPKEKDNKEFIKKIIKEVFQDYDVNEKEGISRQKYNKNLIEKIYEFINFPSTGEQKALKDFLEMTIEKAIEKYYDSSEEFQDFKKIRKIIFFDRQFYKEKYRNYSLLDKKNGFLRLVNEPYYCHNPK